MKGNKTLEQTCQIHKIFAWTKNSKPITYTNVKK